MSIIVRSNERPAETSPANPATEAQASRTEQGEGGSGDGTTTTTLSAPEGEPTEQNESTESEPEETTEPKEGETKEDVEEKGKKKGGFQRRIDKLNARMSAVEREAEYWKQQALSAGESKTTPVINPPASVTPEGKPKPENFDTHTEYVEALADWKTEAKLKERDEKQSRERFNQEQNKIVSSYTDRMKAFSEKTKDFQEVIAEVDHIPLPPALRDIILTSENGPQLAYELAKNPEEYERIAKLSPIACAREVGKLEYRLSSSKPSVEVKEKKITNAPKPLETVGTGGKGSTGKSIFDSSLSQSEYEKVRREQMKRRQA